MSSSIKKRNTNNNYSDSLQTNNLNKFSFWETILPPTILAIITSVVYSFSLKYPFQFDDLAHITKKFAIRNDNPLSRWTHNARWMGDFLNRISYEIGRFDPFYYRILSLITHLLAGIFLFYLIKSLCKSLSNKSFIFKNSTLISFLTSALFLLHPVQTQTVSYVIQSRLEGLATLFSIATMLAIVSALKTKKLFPKIVFSSLGYVLAVLSCGTKETVIVIPLLILICDWFFISRQEWNSFKNRIVYHAMFISFFYVVFLHYIGISFASRALGLKMVVTNNRGNVLTNSAHALITPLKFLISEFKVMLHYLTMFVWPFNISVEYDWKLSESFFSPDSFFPFLLLLSLALFTINALIKKKKNFFVFGIMWFFVTIFPRTTIIPSPELLCDYKTYLASVGSLFIIAVFIAYSINYVIENLKNIPTFFCGIRGKFLAATIFISLVGISTHNRNTVWRSPIEFWGDIVRKAPMKARGHNNYGVSLAEANRIDEAIIEYKKAISLDAYYADPLSNIAVAYSLKNKIDSAINALKAAIAIHPNYPEAYNNLGTLLLKQKNYDDAEKSLNEALKLRPYYGKANYNLGRLEMEKGNHETAWLHFKKATEGDLDTREGFLTLGHVSLKLQKYDEAEKAFESLLRLGYSDNSVMFNLANSYFMNKKLERAEQIYRKLCQSEPLNTKFAFNLAETLYSKGNANEALNIFKRVTTLPNPLAQAFFRVANCYERLGKIDLAKKHLNNLLMAKTNDEFKQVVKNELGRIELAEKVKEGNGSVKMSDIQEILQKAKLDSKKNSV